MSNMASMVEYDRLYKIEVKYPNGEYAGFDINVVSKDSKRVVDALRKAQSEYWASMASGSEGVVAPDVERITLVNCIDSWDWGSESWDHIEGSGPASLADREYLIDHPNAKWIKDNLAVGCANIENFTQPSLKPARRGSKKT